MLLTRRQLLETTAGTLGAAGADQGTPNETGYARWFVIPAPDVFEGDYQGQFLFIDESTDADAGDLSLEDCSFAGWSSGTPQAYEAQLLDRRSASPVAVDVTAYAGAEQSPIEPATHFIIQNVSECPAGDHVAVEGVWVTRRALAGKPPGPTVTETGGTVPGFGPLAAGFGLVLGALLSLLSRHSRDD